MGSRLVHGALRCYPAHWRRRHGDEAAELGALLIHDGAPAVTVAWSYLAGAGREWLTPPPGRRMSAVAYALLAAVTALSISVGLLASTAPARAASTSHGSSSSGSSPQGTGQASSLQGTGPTHCRTEASRGRAC
jgi:hypothetical protein